MKRISAIVTFQVVLLFGFVLAGVPGQVSYQGRLTTSSGSLVPDGIHGLRFSIYDLPAGGNQLWSTTESIQITVRKGLFTYVLGSEGQIPDSLSKYDSLWLGVTIDSDAESVPRTPITSTIYAFRANESSRSDTARHSLDKTISASELTEGTLDTLRYSSYADLVSENRIGNSSEQLARGNHVHAFQSMNHMVLDSNYADIPVPSQAEVLVTTVTVPPNTVGNYFELRVIMYLWANCYLGPAGQSFKVYVNDQLPLSVYAGTNNPGFILFDIPFVRFRGDRFVVRGTETTLDTDLPIEIRITTYSCPPGCNCDIGLGEVVIWYFE